MLNSLLNFCASSIHFCHYQKILMKKTTLSGNQSQKSFGLLLLTPLYDKSRMGRHCVITANDFSLYWHLVYTEESFIMLSCLCFSCFMLMLHRQSFPQSLALTSCGLCHSYLFLWCFISYYSNLKMTGWKNKNKCRPVWLLAIRFWPTAASLGKYPNWLMIKRFS